MQGIADFEISVNPIAYGEAIFLIQKYQYYFAFDNFVVTLHYALKQPYKIAKIKRKQYMKKLLDRIPSGVPCLIVIIILFGSLGAVMGFDHMLNTMMNTAHHLLLDVVFYLMGVCVLTGALSKIFVEFGVVDLLQRILRPVMKPVFNMPGVSSLGAVMTFLSDNPAIISLSQDKAFARYFKKYQHISLVNFGTAFGMGLLVLIFMVGHGYVAAPLLGFIGAMCGCVISTRLMQYFTLRQFPEYRDQDAVVPTSSDGEGAMASMTASGGNGKDTLFVRILNACLDGGKDGVGIGLAIIPGVLIISTFVMMLTNGPTVEMADGKMVEHFTGAAYEGVGLLPWLGGQVDFLFRWLFGFESAELLAFPITALGSVGAALGLVDGFVAQGLIDGNAIAVFTAMGMGWSGYLSSDAATLDSLGYRTLVPKAFLSTFIGGICAGVISHLLFMGFTFTTALFAPQTEWTTTAQAWNDTTNESINVEMSKLDNGSYRIHNWYGKEGADLEFTVNENDSSVNITNAYADKNGEYYFVTINDKAKTGESSYAALYPLEGYSEFDGNKNAGHFYIFAFIYDNEKRLINRCYYEVTWGGRQRQTFEAEQNLENAIKSGETAQTDSMARSLQE